MLRRIVHRLRATFTGPSSHDLADAMRQIDVLNGQVRALQDKVAALESATTLPPTKAAEASRHAWAPGPPPGDKTRAA